MSSIARLIAEMESRGIILSLVDNEIRYRSPKDALTAPDREALRARRDDLTAWLSARDAGRALRGLKGAEGPLITSVAQEMWWRFAGGAQEGKPIALNIGMLATFAADPAAVSAAIRQIVARYDALRASFRVEGENLLPHLNPADSLEIEQEDLRALSGDTARAAGTQSAQEFCARVNFIEGGWLTRAKVIALPGGQTTAALSSAHMIADAGTRNIIIDELRDILEHGASRATPCIPYNAYALAERHLLDGPQGKALIDYWRGWYDDQPVMKSPSGGTPLMWGNGVRIVCNFTLPGPVLDRIRARAQDMKVTPFMICLAIYAISMARWSGLDRFPVRVLGDKRTSMNLSSMVGLMFCADAVEVQAPPSQDFESVMRGIMSAYDASLSLRIPSLHFWAPYCVKPGIEARDFPNKIPAVFNYYSIGTAREKAERPAPAGNVGVSWPPVVTKLPPQIWPRRSSPLFLHMMDTGGEISCSLHFYQDAVNEADQESFTAVLFQTFSDVIGV